MLFTLLSSTATYSTIIVLGALLVLSMFFLEKRFLTREAFFENTRSTSLGTGTLLFTTSWLWIGFLGVLIGITETEGVIGAFTVLAPFTLFLVLQAVVISRGLRSFPRGYSLPQYIESRFHVRSSLLSRIFYLRHVLVAMSGLVVGGYLITILGHVSPAAVVLLLSIVAAVLTLYAGFRALVILAFSIALSTIILVTGVVPWICAAVHISPVVMGHLGLPTIHQWLWGTFMAFILWVFSTTDQDLWQRVYSMQKESFPLSFVLGVCLLWATSLALAFIARAVTVYGVTIAGNNHLLTVLIVMVFLLTLSTIVSSILAIGSIIAVNLIQEKDIVNKYSHGVTLSAREERIFHEQDDRSLYRARVAMRIALGISFIGAIITLFWII